jgi:hypothetical protein
MLTNLLIQRKDAFALALQRSLNNSKTEVKDNNIFHIIMPESFSVYADDYRSFRSTKVKWDIVTILVPTELPSAKDYLKELPSEKYMWNSWIHLKKEFYKKGDIKVTDEMLYLINYCCCYCPDEMFTTVDIEIKENIFDNSDHYDMLPVFEYINEKVLSFVDKQNDVMINDIINKNMMNVSICRLDTIGELMLLSKYLKLKRVKEII